MTARTWRGRLLGVAGALLLLLAATAATAQDEQALRVSGKNEVDGTTLDDYKAALPEFFGPQAAGRARPADIPDIFGPGAVLRVGNVFMKVTNYGLIGNPYTSVSNDPSGQWPGASGVEYLNAIALAVGGVNPTATDPNAVRRVSYFTVWRPQTLDPVDKMYAAYDGIPNGARFVNDDLDFNTDGTPRIDEDFLDGHDNDLDGKIDEDFGALGQQMYTCVVWDNTVQALNTTYVEKFIPLNLECQQAAWAYSIPGYTDFNVIQWTIFNRSGHVLDSMVVGGVVDMDCGPIDKSSYWSDDMNLNGFPSGIYPHQTLATDKRLQGPSMRAPATPAGISPDSALCSHFNLKIHGFSIADDDGDNGKTTGIPSFLLVDHTIDPLGETGPSQVGFTAWRAFTGGAPYDQGGSPRTNQQRFEFMVGASGANNVDANGFPTKPAEGGEGGAPTKGDWASWWSCGPWRNVPDNGSIQVTVAFSVALGDFKTAANYESDYKLADQGGFPGGKAALLTKYPSVANAYAIQAAFEGTYEERSDWPYLTNGHGRETMVKVDPGAGSVSKQDCHDREPRIVTYLKPDWFDFDCDYCTGAFDSKNGIGMFHHTWAADSPPPNPNTNTAATYNYSDNPSRVVPAGDNQITVAWDNLSEVTPDPKSGWLDFRGYQVWKAANWTRPVGSAGPNDDDWALIGEFRQFHYYASDPSTGNVYLVQQNYVKTSDGDSICPKVLVPNHVFPPGSPECPNGCVGPDSVEICLRLDDIWDRQSGQIIHPSDAVGCFRDASGECVVESGCINGRTGCGDPGNRENRERWNVGRYRLVDHEVKNGFVYFYSITAFDSTGSGKTLLELSGRRSATEADGVTPQVSTRSGKSVWVVPNPYRGFRNIADRPSSWDLTPTGSDPTGTHIDFMGLPRGAWTIKIFTVSGDLVQTLRSVDQVNESIRSPVTVNGQSVPGYNRQQDDANDGEARWNLISRNGQDIVSGIYLFTVESDQGTQRGKFVVIR